MRKIVFDSNNTSINVEDIRYMKIYAFVCNAKVYILKEIDNKYAWINFESIEGSWNGYFYDEENAMKSVTDQKVFEFENLAEFMEWMQS